MTLIIEHSYLRDLNGFRIAKFLIASLIQIKYRARKIQWHTLTVSIEYHELMEFATATISIKAEPR